MPIERHCNMCVKVAACDDFTNKFTQARKHYPCKSFLEAVRVAGYQALQCKDFQPADQPAQVYVGDASHADH